MSGTPTAAAVTGAAPVLHPHELLSEDIVARRCVCTVCPASGMCRLGIVAPQARAVGAGMRREAGLCAWLRGLPVSCSCLVDCTGGHGTQVVRALDVCLEPAL